MDKAETLVDARGLSCPMPLLKAKLALNMVEVGQRVRVLATDAGSQRDFTVFAQQSGHSLLESAVEDGEGGAEHAQHFVYLLEKRPIA